MGSAVAEMRSGLYLSGTPEDGLINMACIEMSKFYGLRSQGSAVSCDAKACDLQAGAEGMLTGLATALAGADVMLAFGLMDSAQTASLAKTVLDADTVNAIERFLRDDPVDEARALVDDIVDVGIGGHFLARKSTRQFYRAGELWQPQPVAPRVVRALRRHVARQGRLGAGSRADRGERRAAAAGGRPAARERAHRRVPARPRVRSGRVAERQSGARPSAGAAASSCCAAAAPISR